jgi:hypothetical protein
MSDVRMLICFYTFVQKDCYITGSGQGEFLPLSLPVLRPPARSLSHSFPQMLSELS